MATDLVELPADEDGVLSWLRDMCDSAPVYRDENDTWHVFGHPESAQALSDHHALSSDVAVPVPDGSPMKLYRSGNLSWMDPPRHQKLRALVSRVFTPRYVAGLEPVVTATVDEFLHRIRSNETVEYVDEYVSGIVSTVTARMLGIPLGAHDLFRTWSRDLTALTDPASAQNRLRVVVENTRLINAFLHEFIRRRRNSPGDDLTSGLIAAEVDGELLDDDEIAGLVALLMSTGQAATLTLANAVICLDRHPDTTESLRANGDLLRSAIEEVMRYRSQTTRLARRTVADVTVGGQRIPRGRPVSVWLAAANRDHRIFRDPDVFDITRSPNPHIALGHGIHYCLGASLARMEIEIALSRFLRETREFEIDYSRSRLLDPRLMFGASEISVKVDWR